VERLLLEPARAWPAGQFVVAGPQYPDSIAWPANCTRYDHLPPDEHPAFYSAQRFTLNVTRQDMIAAGYSPSVRLFEAAACGTPIISDWWSGLDTFFEPDREIFIAESADQALQLLQDTPEAKRRAVAERARRRALAEHTARHRVAQLEGYLRRLAPQA
jgi:spore maturation protein CgeB